ncbi:MAG: element excision factor XisI family protein [Prochlorotrichaceae cyanobacterium]
MKSSQIKFFVVDLTKQGIANELLEAGVLPEDIVLGFHPPQKRPLTEFVVA